MEVKYIDHMGDDIRVANAARVSFNKESEWEQDYRNWDGTSARSPDFAAYSNYSLSEKDQKLIQYLAKHNHWTPFSHVQITMREKVPIFVARQRFKHMVGFTYNEVSRRYVDDNPEFFTPDVWRSRPEGGLKQGSGEGVRNTLDWNFDSTLKAGLGPNTRQAYKEFIEYAERYYKVLIGNGVAPEQARMVLPQSMYTEYYVTGSLPAWARAYKLRIDGHAQKEIQDLAKMWNEVISEIPELKYSWEALAN